MTTRKLFFLMTLCLFANQLRAQHTMTVDASKPVAEIAPTMYGVFFEDINFGADGGLYAELIKNRSFEFPQSFMGWNPFGRVTIEEQNPCFDRNPHYIRLENDGSKKLSGIDNEGFRGIGVRKGSEYRFSFYARTQSEEAVQFTVDLMTPDGKSCAQGKWEVSNKEWTKQTLLMKSNVTEAHCHLRIMMRTKGVVDMEHISLFPVDTWKGRENGLRKDLVQALYELNPKVLRFPGGCIVEGNTLETRYQWKHSVGTVENRPLNENRWNYIRHHRYAPDYFQSYGLGFYEFFLLSEDLGAEPIPILSCGIACQYEGDQVAPLDSLQPYIQDALDLIEFANGPTSSTWGKLRAEMGHPEPFNLKYVGIGNEQWGEIYPERLEPFVEAIRAQYPDIQVIGSSGPKSGGDRFDYLWPEMKRIGVDLVDEHYYEQPEWFFAHADRYDSYDRKGPKVFAGEYASKTNTWRSALAEAAFMTGLERNADHVRMATYAPLFAHIDASQWSPDLIWMDNLRLMRTPNYFVQQMYGMNAGTDVLSLLMNGKPVCGQDSLYATAALDGLTNEIILKLVNANDTPRKVTIDIKGMKRRILTAGTCTYLECNDLKAENTLDEEIIIPHTVPYRPTGNRLELELPARWFGVYRLK